MKRRKIKNILITIGIIAVVIFLLVLYFAQDDESDNSAKYEGIDLSSDVEGLGRENTYAKYLKRMGNAESPLTTVEVDLFSYTDSAEIEIWNDFEGEEKVLVSNEDGYIEWQIYVEEEGYYNAYIEYYPIESRGIDIERCFYINGEMPFIGADALTFTRVWTDGGEVTRDNQDNDIRPSQIESPSWQSAYFKDYMGYYSEPYKFYLKKGINTIKLEAVNEPLVLRTFKLLNEEATPNYESYLASKEGLNTYANSDYLEIIEGEDAIYRSSPSLYARFDRSSSNTSPYSSSKIRLNIIGTDAWRVAGQWIEWEIDIPEDGYYEIAVKGRQNYERGFVSNRMLYIDGKVPFTEVSTIEFSYSNEWELLTLGDEEGNAYKFYLTEGTHVLRLEVTLGELGEMLQELEDSVYRMNEMYRKILILTGTEPDRFRDYQLDTHYPEVIEAMLLESQRLYKIVDEVVAYTGQKAEAISVAQTLAAQMEKFYERPDKIPQTLKNFKENISSLGNSILSMSEAALDIDYITVNAIGVERPEVSETFFERAVHEFKSFIASFVEDYNSLGNVYDDENAITVWMLSGRDQSNILKAMIDDTFTPEYGIYVNVKLVDADTLLPAVVAGTGPNVALSVSQDKPVNFALRNAAVDLTQFEGYEEVFSSDKFYESAYTPFMYDGGIYGIPETQIYNVLFYRTDILEELGLEPPNTWDELIAMLPTLQHNNLTVGVPSTERKFGNVSSPDLSNVFAQLYQRGGSLYSADGSKSLLDSEASVAGFEFVTKLFTQYKLPTEYDFVNRFRSGEMPIGIADYNNYNTLAVFAPEIRGLWDFTTLPGTEKEDGTVDKSVSCWGVCSMMLANTDNQDLSWEFLKWWSSTETQVRYGRELESVMGSSARYATANIEAFEQLSWSKSQRETLIEQWKWVVGNPEVPGGYYTSWHIVNAVRKVVNDNDDPRETLLDYTRTINEEIQKKRKEFGLDTEE